MNQDGDAVLCELEYVEKEAHSPKVYPTRGDGVPVVRCEEAGTRPLARVGLAINAWCCVDGRTQVVRYNTVFAVIPP